MVGRFNSKYASLGLFLALTGLPLVLGIGYSLLHSTGLAGIGPKGFTPAHWGEVLTGSEFWRSLGFSFWVAACSIGLALGLALAAVVRGQERWQRGILSWLIYLPLALPAMVVAFLVFQTLSGAGLASRLAFRLGLTGGIEGFPNWVNDPWGVGIIAAHVLMATPFFIILFSNLYQSERLGEYAQLAATLGATARQSARRVIVPVLLRQSFPTLVLYFIFVMGSYEIPLLLGSQSPQMVSVLTIRKLQRFDLADMPQAYVVGVLYSVFVVGAVVLLLRSKTEKTTTA
ncbi:MAG: ABC transporter permease subunit [Bacteroidetes bacterium]|nr:ABC transporter permease subunit [Bacteroidota bacterium]